MELYTLLTFFLIVSVMVMSPGPNGALLLKNVPTFGKQHGYANVLGIVVAFYLQGTLSVSGLSAIIVSSANLFLLVKILGALYLAYLGVKAIVSAFAKKTTLLASNKNQLTHSNKRLTASFIEGLLTNLLNPKVSIFYLAAFPQFVSFEQEALLASFGLVTIHAIFAAIWFSSLVVLIGKSSHFTKSDKFQRAMQSVTGSLLIWFSYRVATVK